MKRKSLSNWNDIRKSPVRNGTIRGFGDHGIDALFSTNTVFRRLRVMDNYDAGILAGTACSILETVSSRNGVRQGRSGVGVGIKKAPTRSGL